MAQRIRVRVGTTKSGSPVLTWVSGRNQDELNDNIVKAYIESGRIWEFMDKQGSTNESDNNPKITFGDYVKQWIEYKSHKIKPTTLNGYKTMLKSHFIPGLGKMVFESITPTDLQNFLNERSYLSRKYLSDMKKTFSMICKDAIEDGVLTNNPAESRKLYIPSEKKLVRKALEKEDFADIAIHLPELQRQDRLLMALLMYTGMRLGEVLGLKWEDIDLENKCIYVRRSVTHPTNTPLIGTPKTENGVRTIPLVSELEMHLIPFDKTGFIIGGDAPYSKAMHRRAWERIGRQIELHGATAHIFRHTFLTMLAATGIDPKTIQAIAGHGDIQITMNRYVHPVNENISEAGKLLEKQVFCAGFCA